MKLVTIHVCDNTMEAHLMRCYFESEGVQCFVHDEHTVDMYQLYSFAIGGVKLKVWEEDLEISRKLIRSWFDSKLKDSENKVIECPSCGSTDINYDHRTMKGFKGCLSILGILLSGQYPLYFKRIKKCRNCRNEFE